MGRPLSVTKEVVVHQVFQKKHIAKVRFAPSIPDQTMAANQFFIVLPPTRILSKHSSEYKHTQWRVPRRVLLLLMNKNHPMQSWLASGCHRRQGRRNI